MSNLLERIALANEDLALIEAELKEATKFPSIPGEVLHLIELRNYYAERVDELNIDLGGEG
jgi:hypothetical protein